MMREGGGQGEEEWDGVEYEDGGERKGGMELGKTHGSDGKRETEREREDVGDDGVRYGDR